MSLRTCRMRSSTFFSIAWTAAIRASASFTAAVRFATAVDTVASVGSGTLGFDPAPAPDGVDIAALGVSVGVGVGAAAGAGPEDLLLPLLPVLSEGSLTSAAPPRDAGSREPDRR